ncbi:MAG: aminoglycoside phosphotransferase family protein [Bdellovibrionales bacterium]
MKHRAVEIAGFISQSGWDGARETPLQADFSARQFARLERERAAPPRAILMDAPGDQKTAAFVAIAKMLRGMGLSAPEIYAENAPEGLVLMEDFGDRNIGRLIDSGTDAGPFFKSAVDVLVQLHAQFRPAMAAGIDLPVFGSALFASQVELFLDAYVPFARQREATPEESESFRAAWKGVLKDIDALPQTLILRDFMPDNLMLIEYEDGWRSVGLLDFQDGGLGPLPYDLASLCEVVRRDGEPSRLDSTIDYYYEKAAPKLAKEELRRTCRILSAQRHTRILGIIARHASKTGRREKLDYMPRVWKYLEALCEEPALRPVQEWMERNISGRV